MTLRLKTRTSCIRALARPHESKKRSRTPSTQAHIPAGQLSAQISSSESSNDSGILPTPFPRPQECAHKLVGRRRHRVPLQPNRAVRIRHATVIFGSAASILHREVCGCGWPLRARGPWSTTAPSTGPRALQAGVGVVHSRCGRQHAFVRVAQSTKSYAL